LREEGRQTGNGESETECVGGKQHIKREGRETERKTREVRYGKIRQKEKCVEVE
jgi:hypothetical protein